MNGSVAHIVVVAKDSGIPARQTSAPVIVHFPSGSVSAQPRSLEQNVFMVTLVLGLISGLLLIVIFSMLVYICKSKKGSRLHPPSSTPSADPSGHMSKHLNNYSTYGGEQAYNTRSEIMYQPSNHFHGGSEASGLDPAQNNLLLQRHPSHSALNPLNPHHRSSKLSLNGIGKIFTLNSFIVYSFFGSSLKNSTF